MVCDLWVVIPTYWGRPEVGIYDHPTPLDGTSTLPILLDTLATQDFQQEFRVLVLVSTTGSDLKISATNRVEEIIRNYSDRLDLSIANSLTARKIDEYLQPFGLELGLRDMRGYAAVRNMQLLIPAALGAETIIALDDDELVEADYLNKAVQNLGREINGEKVVAIAGPYLDDSGSPYLQEPTAKTNLLLDKGILMNQTMKNLFEGKSALSVSPIAFGGNMIFHRSLFSQVGFDPGITRGEDIDYLINARIAGYDFYFDPGLTILHRPPRQFEAPQYAKLRQDVIRFEYERQKVHHFGVNPESLMPYPGSLLSEDFPNLALHALRLESSPKWESMYGSPQDIVDFSRENAKIKIQEYQIFRGNWARALEILIGGKFAI